MLISPLNILKAVFKLFKKHSNIFLKYSLLIFVPSLILMLVQYSLSYFILFLGNALIAFTLYILLTLAISVFSIWVSLALVRDIAKMYDNEEITFWNNFYNTTNLILPAILVSILTFLAILGGFVLFIIPAIIFAIWFSFSLHALILDNKHGIEALVFSKKLIEKRWWKTVWRIFIPALFFTLIIVLLEWLFALILGVSDETVLNLPTFIYIMLVMMMSSFIAPVASSAVTVLYLELKKTPAKKELIDDTLEN